MYSRPLALVRRPFALLTILAFLVTLIWYRHVARNHRNFAGPLIEHASEEKAPTRGYFSHFSPGVSKPPGSHYSRALIIPRLQKEDVSWISSQVQHVQQFVYVVDDPSATLHPPANKGNEAMVYLTYLIDHYDNLPDIMIFMHSHGNSWHNEEPLDFKAAELINRLSSERVMRDGYMNLRCNWAPGCPDWIHPEKEEADPSKPEEAILAKAWSELFPFAEVPTVLSQACCAQFAVSRERARAIPRSRYVFYRDWILRTELQNYISGRVWEYLWQVVFTGKNVFCPAQHACYCDGFGVCFGGAKGLDEYFDLARQRRAKEWELFKWKELSKEIQEAIEKGLSDEEIQKLEKPEPGRDEVLEREIEDKKQELAKMVEQAKERGKDPRIRAEEAGRVWKEGDGF
ncbi:hypothetical protein BDDG_06420 [Blastomyces dermatitidis ATCC 18188]|uniref:Uncharacterized protein n=1 Tax=Ajellomyces dermatitidis (strain ATCC 18188 / CBS 674.68) TaxID=653446 RepID=F2TJS1_AJEDA|nr:hypothetical protein BDDG_06420 [Blastomyces dermatitidis ATCC 18188]